jgi:hypothetical protein
VRRVELERLYCKRPIQCLAPDTALYSTYVSTLWCAESRNVKDPIKYILTLAAGLFTIISMGGAQLFAVGEFIVAGVGAYGGHTRTQAARLLTVVPRRVLITRGWTKIF